MSEAYAVSMVTALLVFDVVMLFVLVYWVATYRHEVDRLKQFSSDAYHLWKELSELYCKEKRSLEGTEEKGFFDV